MTSIVRPVALVIAASAPCGQAIVSELAKTHFVYAQYNSTLPDLQDENVKWVKSDLSKPLGSGSGSSGEWEARALIAQIIDEKGRLDVLVNVIGPVSHTHVNDLKPEEWDCQMHMNLNIVYYLCHHAMGHIKASKGHIINFSYAGAEHIKTQLDTLPYSIAKTGIVILSKTFAAAFGDSGARCNVIAPGFIDSEIVLDKTRERARNMVPMKRMATVDEIAGCVKMLLTSPEYVTGSVTNCAGGLEFP